MLDEWLEIGKKKKDEGWVRIQNASSLYRVLYENPVEFCVVAIIIKCDRLFHVEWIRCLLCFTKLQLCSRFFASASFKYYHMDVKVNVIRISILDTGISYICLYSLLSCIRWYVILFSVLAHILPQKWGECFRGCQIIM